MEHRNRTTFAASLPATPMVRNRLRWFGSWTDRQRYRHRQAYFRPTDTLALNAALDDLIDQIVAVRFADVAGANSPFTRQSLYQIVVHKSTASTYMRPE